VIALIGLPGAGKGTQAQLLEEDGWFHVNVGGLVRSEVAAGTRWGTQAAATMRRGDLVPSQAVQDLLARELRNGKPPVVIEGYPRRLSEAGTLPGLCGYDAMFIPVLFDIAAEPAIRRLAGRFVCGRCERVANRERNGVCPQCAGPLVCRDDDISRETVRRRLLNFERETVPLIEYYRSRGELEVVNAGLDEASVRQELASRVASRCGLPVDSVMVP
jgi:adenylate kinase